MSAALDLTTDGVVVTDLPQPVERDPCPVACGSLPAWCVVQCRPQAEQIAVDHLREQGFLAYLPTYAARRHDKSIRGGWREVACPLFSGYAFVAPHDDFWGPIVRTIGVARLLMDNGRPHFLRKGLVEALQAAGAARLNPDRHRSPWQPGAACRVASGAFEGHEAVVVATHQDRAHVQLLLFGAVRNVNVSLAALSPRNE